MIAFARTLVGRILAHDVPGAAAELAFRFLFALFPFFIFVATLSGFVARWLDIGDPAERIVGRLTDALSDDAAGVLERSLQSVFESNSAGLLSFGAVLALWAASSGTKTLVKSINRAYGLREGRSFLHQQALGVGLTVVGGAVLIAGTLSLIVGQVVGEDIARSAGAGDTGAAIINLARIPLVLVCLVAAVAGIYRVAPDARPAMRSVAPGAVAFVVLWLAATLAFAIYVSNFGSYDATYGALGGVIVLMLWLYLTALLLVLGAEVNATLEGRETTPAAPPTPEPDAAGASDEGAEPQPPQASRRRFLRLRS